MDIKTPLSKPLGRGQNIQLRSGRFQSAMDAVTHSQPNLSHKAVVKIKERMMQATVGPQKGESWGINEVNKWKRSPHLTQCWTIFCTTLFGMSAQYSHNARATLITDGQLLSISDWCCYFGSRSFDTSKSRRLVRICKHWNTACYRLEKEATGQEQEDFFAKDKEGNCAWGQKYFTEADVNLGSKVQTFGTSFCWWPIWNIL